MGFGFVVRLGLALLLTLAPAQAKRLALVIGNADYVHAAPLKNPRNDADDMAIKLEAMGFEVVKGINLDLSGMRVKIQEFVNRLSGTELSAFYYAGHGLQIGGKNYLMPVDAALESSLAVDFEAVPVDLILTAMEQASDTNIVFLDACRNNPMARNLARSMGTRSAEVGRGLARVGSGLGTLISFATQPGNVALDGTGRNSPYTHALLQHLGKPGRDITRDLVNVRRAVLDATDERQVPWENSSLTGELILVPGADEPQKSAAPTKAPNEAEMAFWDSIKDGKEAALFEAYIRQYPTGSFIELAKVRIELLKTEAKKTEDAPDKLAALTVTDQIVDKLTEQISERELVRQVQNELNRVGCAVGGADGVWGSRSARGLKQFISHNDEAAEHDSPSQALLALLKDTEQRVCPLVCGSGYKKQNGQCVRTAASPARSAVSSASSCPANATRASGSLWSFGSLPSNRIATKTHPCGRKIRCKGGNNSIGRPRSCSWL